MGGAPTIHTYNLDTCVAFSLPKESWGALSNFSPAFPLRVNGVVVQKLALQPGDQLGVAMHRFVVDGPGMEPEPEIVMAESLPQRLPEDVAGPSGEVWWLIVTAAVLALGIALVLLIRF